MPSEKLQCPKCWVDMDKKIVEVLGPDIEIDVCPECMGIFLDDGELKKLVKDKKLTDFLTKEIGTQSKSELVCPKCGSLMDIESAEEIEVDVCLECSGVWLDAGELEGLKELSEEGYELDEDAKMSERYEEMVYRSKHSLLARFIKKLSK
ncbi:MAG: zf-TFIIB domain-containing protein [Thermoplasmata archaeon]